MNYIDFLTSYQAIRQFYGDKRAERSNVPLMNHIDEGIEILDYLNASDAAKAAFCLHPIFQDDSAWPDALDNEIIRRVDPKVIILVMEYRKTANAYLCRPFTDWYTLKELEDHCPLVLDEVRDMLIADKIQNRKDFEIHHLGTHNRSIELYNYFKRWLRYLEVSEEQYLEITKSIKGSNND